MTEKLTERVSVVLPAYNEGTSVGTLVSDLRRTGSWHEIIVVDDGSTDDTAHRAAEVRGSSGTRTTKATAQP